MTLADCHKEYTLLCNHYLAGLLTAQEFEQAVHDRPLSNVNGQIDPATGLRYPD